MNTGPKVIQVIESTITRGAGTDDDPVRMVKQHHALDGAFLCERDPIYDIVSRNWQKLTDYNAKLPNGTEPMILGPNHYSRENFPI